MFVDLINIHWKQTKKLEIINSEAILDGKKITGSEIVFIKFIKIVKNGFDTVLFRIIQDGQIKDVCIMDKPKFLKPWGSTKSTTLKQLYSYFPDWKEKQI